MATGLGVLLAIQIILTAGLVSAQSGTREFDVRVDKSVLVKMTDGTRLSTDIYYPVGASEPLPTVLIQLPYDKNGYRGARSPANYFARNGFVVVVQDMRGRFESEGVYVVSKDNRDDGYDTLSWIAEQGWSNGKVGTYGCSYLGETQIQLATARHPNHTAAIPQAAGGGFDGTYRPFLYMDGGAFELASGLSWFSFAGSKSFNIPPPETPDSTYSRIVQNMQTGLPTPPIDLVEAFKELPVIDILSSRGFPKTDYEDFIRHIPGDPYWKTLNYATVTDSFNVPALHVNSWYDLGPRETLMTFNLMQTNATGEVGRENQFVIISPTDHCRSESARNPLILGERDLGDPTFAYFELYRDWFDHFLRGVDNGVTDRPRIQYFLLGANEWRYADAWPLPTSERVSYYLHSGGAANSLAGDGSLTTVPPEAEPPDEFSYDPADPVPSVGGPICCTSPSAAPAGSYDQTEVEKREDVLVYTSEPFTEGVEVTGELEAVLYVASSARDTDFTVKLVDVYPDGRAFNVQESILRARFREGYDKVVHMDEGEVYELHIDLHATANYFGPGHRIRVEVSSSNFPRFDRNLNTGGNNYDESEWVVARNKVYHDRRYPSRIVLPIVTSTAAGQR